MFSTWSPTDAAASTMLIMMGGEFNLYGFFVLTSCWLNCFSFLVPNLFFCFTRALSALLLINFSFSSCLIRSSIVAPSVPGSLFPGSLVPGSLVPGSPAPGKVASWLLSVSCHVLFIALEIHLNFSLNLCNNYKVMLMLYVFCLCICNYCHLQCKKMN